MVYWPLHPNPQVALAIKVCGEAPPDNLIFLPAQDRHNFLALLGRAMFVITDSGGVQEEAALWGIPAVIARRKTDRQETVDSGHAYLVGHNGPEIILPFVKHIATQPPLPRYGGYDGMTGFPSDAIATHLASLEGISLFGLRDEEVAGGLLSVSERLMPGTPIVLDIGHQEVPPARLLRAELEAGDEVL